MSDHESSLSRSRSYREIGEYWDSHDAGEDQLVPAEFEVDIRSEKRYYPIEKLLSQKLDRIAATQGVSPETLINLWVQEKVDRSQS
ncbi:MAG: hypothetical protein WAM82_16825 [Thermoanaerobaculia bacterium]